jgi:hypothetical protein
MTMAPTDNGHRDVEAARLVLVIDGDGAVLERTRT